MTAGKMDRAAREAAPWVERLARAGYTARGVVYLFIALIAARAAAGGRSPGGAGDALNEVERQPGGDWLVMLLAIGLAGFALWRFVQAAFDPENKSAEGEAKGALHRVRYAAQGVIHLALAATALRVSRGGRAGDEAGWYDQAISPMGRVAIAAVALGFLAYGIHQLGRAWRSDLDDHLNLGEVSASTRAAIVKAGRFGIAARGVVFVIVGGLLGDAAVGDRNPDREPGLGGALQTLLDQPYGRVLLALMAVGLASYGVFELVRARYRRISAR